MQDRIVEVGQHNGLEREHGDYITVSTVLNAPNRIVPPHHEPYGVRGRLERDMALVLAHQWLALNSLP